MGALQRAATGYSWCKKVSKTEGVGWYGHHKMPSRKIGGSRCGTDEVRWRWGIQGWRTQTLVLKRAVSLLTTLKITPILSEGEIEKFPWPMQDHAILPVHVVRMELHLQGLAHELVHASGLVEKILVSWSWIWRSWLNMYSATDKLSDCPCWISWQCFFHPGLRALDNPTNAKITTLKRDAVHTWGLHT